ncbi:MAG: YggS family pyridoxal phosphate-dependent enzyme [Ferruginibacter sp.]
MAFLRNAYHKIQKELEPFNASLVAVTKMRSTQDIMQAYDLGQRDFGENYVQELLEKHDTLPKDIRWHFIGHLQTNKVKHIAPFIHLIHGVDSHNLLLEINKQAKKMDRVISCLLQVHISKEETKFGLSETEVNLLIHRFVTQPNELNGIQLSGLMGMASFTEDNDLIISEFNKLKDLYHNYKASLSGINNPFAILSMGMSADYRFAIEAGSNMVRIGSLLFGSRERA